MKYITLAEHLSTPVHYKVRTDYSNPVKFEQSENKLLFNDWDIDLKLAERVIWVSNLDIVTNVYKVDLLKYLLGAPPGTIVSLAVPHDQFDYNQLRPLFQKHKEYYNKHGKCQNYFTIDLVHEVDRAFKEEFKDVVSFIHDKLYWLTLNIDGHTLIDEINNFRLNNYRKEFKKHFLSLNNRASWDRQSMFYFMHKFDLLDKSYFSYQCQNSDRSEYGGQFNELHNIIGDCWFSEGLDINNLKNRIPLVIDGLNNQIEIADTVNFYNTSFCSVILETFQRLDDPLITEKTIKAIACEQPFLVFGSNGLLEELKSFGFETFSDIFDESYDKIQNPQLRLEQIFREMLKISNWSIKECEEKYNIVKYKIKHNSNRLLEIWNDHSNTMSNYYQCVNNIYSSALQKLNV